MLMPAGGVVVHSASSCVLGGWGVSGLVAVMGLWTEEGGEVNRCAYLGNAFVLGRHLGTCIPR